MNFFYHTRLVNEADDALRVSSWFDFPHHDPEFIERVRVVSLSNRISPWHLGQISGSVSKTFLMK
jgi:hypothetical protein